MKRNIFILAHQMGDRKFYPTYKKLIQNQWKSYEVLKGEQEKQLRNMINFAYNNVPYYRKLFDDLRLSTDDIKIHNTDDKETFRNIVDAFSEVDETIVFPVHPRTEKFLKEYGY